MNGHMWRVSKGRHQVDSECQAFFIIHGIQVIFYFLSSLYSRNI